MKKIYTILIAILLFGLTIQACNFESHYSRIAKITNVHNNIITVKDKTGNIWEFKGKGFTKGNKIKLIFDNNNTDEREDDEIVNAFEIK